MRGQTYSILLILFVTTALFQNCGKSFQSTSNQSPLSSFCKASPQVLTPFELKKVHWPQSFNQASFKASSATTEVVVVVDTQCLSEQPDVPFFEQSLYIEPENRNFKTAALSVKLNTWPSLAQLQEEAEKNPCIFGISENKPVVKNQSLAVNDPLSSQQNHLNFLGFQQSLALQRQITAKVVVAVVDSGIDYLHQDLRNQMWQDNEGRFGWNFASTTTQDPRDDDGHGTHVAGIIGAESNNSFAISGLTTGYVELMAVKVLDQNGAGSSQAVYNGIQYAITNGADVINISLEAVGENPLLESAIINAVTSGVVVVIAAGNQGEQITANNLFAPAYVGSRIEGAMTVASMDVNSSNLSFFSNFSAEYTEIAAPGAEFSSSDTGILSTHLNNSWRRIMGTSQAAPMVTSAAALLIGYLKTKNEPFAASAIENFIKTGGVAQSNRLSSQVNGGHLLHIGFLSQNMIAHFASAPDGEDFNGNNNSGRTCVIQ